MVSNQRGWGPCGRSLAMSNVTFYLNKGGALAVFSGNLEMMSSNFTDNSDTALYFETSNLTDYRLEVIYTRRCGYGSWACPGALPRVLCRSCGSFCRRPEREDPSPCHEEYRSFPFDLDACRLAVDDA